MCNVVFEDNQILVVIKPQNVPVQKDESNDIDLLSQLKEYLVKKYNKVGNAYLGLVHRLDRPTGGIMVFAKTSKSAERLCNQIKTDEFEKTYFAVVEGCPRQKIAVLTNYLKKDEKNNIVKICPQYEDGSKIAVLDYQVLEEKEGKSLVKINLQTGRSHQIRVQFAGIGCPLVNDAKYNKNASKGNLGLWATVLKFYHPVSKQKLTFKALPPVEEKIWKIFNVEKYL